MRYYAHSDRQKDKNHWHLLQNHLRDTAKSSAGFAGKFGAEKLGYVAGLFHDIGKYSNKFQRRLEGESIRVDHSTAGAITALNYHKVYGVLLAYVLAGHHCGLPDWGSKADESTLESRLNNKSLPDFSAYKTEMELPASKELTFPLKKAIVSLGFSAQFFIRFLYSALVDADFLDTERALNIEKHQLRDSKNILADMLLMLNSFLDGLCCSAKNTTVNQCRLDILEVCKRKAFKPPGFFTLTVPTGGGKTLSSMAFALNHAVKHNMDRVIYVIPYTSIIEQNAAVFRDIFGADNVLEHHSNFTYPDADRLEEAAEFVGTAVDKLKLAAENWDIAVVVTTNVQFFESLYASKSSRCRKLHNIVNSIIVIDEAQMIPTGYLSPCINALTELVANYNTSVILCTATQPALGKLIAKEIRPTEIIDEPEKLYKKLKRVSVTHLGVVSDNQLGEKLLNHEQVLCILNSKRHARLIYEKVNSEGSFHLSTRMCPRHRTEILDTIRQRLKSGKTCRVVSTQLIEAGVDIDFPVVYRSVSGIDSIAQAAGRCNREGRLEIGSVYVFRPEKHGLPAGWLSRTASIGETTLAKHKEPLDLKAVKEYFTLLYDIEGEELDKKRIMEEIVEQEAMLRFPFRSLAEKFKLMYMSTQNSPIF
jgi:CRISPR-associated endonuclease/helicase Cas3